MSDQTWLVDASACGQKGLLWRTHLGGDKFVTRNGDGPGFVANGTRFQGVEEYRGWVKSSANGLWLPVSDTPAIAGNAATASARAAGPTYARQQPVGRSTLGRDASGLAIPYLHKEECRCGGRWCTPEPVAPPPAQPLPSPYEWPKREPRASPQPRVKVASAKPWDCSWTVGQFLAGSLLALALLLLITLSDGNDSRVWVPHSATFSWGSWDWLPIWQAGGVSLPRALEPYFRG